jgi:hypothetical protein
VEVEVVTVAIGALGSLVVEMWRRRSGERRATEAAADERGEAYETFVGDVFNAFGALHRLVGLAPTLGALPLSAPAHEAVRDAQAAQDAVTRSHARVRRLASDDVAAASDALLEALAHAAELTSARQRAAGAWGQIWDEARAARIEFERLARVRAGP